VIVDLPPIKEVSDALAVANKLDGMLLVVRQNICSRTELDATVRQLSFINAKILGMVFNGLSESGKSYRRKYYSRNRHYGYYYRKNIKIEEER
jgi:Mrp family chromosome partitioning ATPase